MVALTPDMIVARVERFFGDRIVKMTAPGGTSRESFRVYFKDRTIIVSHRRDAARSRRERYALETLGPICEAMPDFLGATDGLVFQGDAGARRLNHAIHTCPPGGRVALADTAVAGIFAIHRAARRAGLTRALPGPEPAPTADDDLIAGVGQFARYLGQTPPPFDPAALCAGFRAEPRQFIKSDCRAGNAAFDPTGGLRWFDFEGAQIAHGPEDFAWLIADETWPLHPDAMLPLVRAHLTTDDSADVDGYMCHLEQLTVLQAIRRTRLIMREARRGGWLDRTKVLKYDKVGVDPYLGEGLCDAARSLARRHRATTPLVPLFKAAAEAFRAARVRGQGVAEVSPGSSQWIDSND